MNRNIVALAGLFFGLNTALHAAETTVMSGGAVEPGLKAAAAAFEKRIRAQGQDYLQHHAANAQTRCCR